MRIRDVAAQHLRRSAAAPVPLVEFAASPLYCSLDLSPGVERVMRDSAGKSIVVCRAGQRGGKTSRLIAPAALHAAWTVPIPLIGAGEVARAMLIAPDLETARQTLSFVKGYVLQSPVLATALLGEPTTDHLDLKRPDGKPVRIEVKAASARGRTTRGRSLVFVAMDEASFFRDRDTGVVNDEEVFASIEGRVVPGAQIWIVSTAWVADVGLLEGFMAKGSTDDVLTVQATTRELNPHWDPDGKIERRMRERDPENAAREIDGKPVGASAVTFFEPACLANSIDKTLVLPRKPQPGEEVCGALDAGFRRNSTAGCVTHRRGREMLVADLWERRPEPGKPLKPSVVLSEASLRFRSHAGLGYVVADGHYREAVNEVLAAHDLSLKDAPSDVSEPYIRTRALMREGRLRIPDDPKLLSQLRSVMWRPTPGGGIAIVLPQSKTGEHCDLVAVLVLAVWESAGLDVPEPPPPPGTPAHNKMVEDRYERELVEQIDRDDQEEREARKAWQRW